MDEDEGGGLAFKRAPVRKNVTELAGRPPPVKIEFPAERQSPRNEQDIARVRKDLAETVVASLDDFVKKIQQQGVDPKRYSEFRELMRG